MIQGNGLSQMSHKFKIRPLMTVPDLIATVPALTSTSREAS